jgi:hypothetical protein
VSVCVCVCVCVCVGVCVGVCWGGRGGGVSQGEWVYANMCVCMSERVGVSAGSCDYRWACVYARNLYAILVSVGRWDEFKNECQCID